MRSRNDDFPRPAGYREDGAQGTPKGARSAFEHRPQRCPDGLTTPPRPAGYREDGAQGTPKGARSAFEHRPQRCPAGLEAGFTLAEMLVTLVILSVVLVAALGLFDFNSRVGRVQTQMANMQQSLRIAQYDVSRLARMAGRGGLPVRSAPARPLPTGVAVDVRNDVAANQHIGVSNNAGPFVLPGTDVLTVRGVFSTPLYQVNFANAVTFTLGDPVGGGQLILSSTSPTGVPQDLTPLRQVVEDKVPEALLLVSPLEDSIYAVVELVATAPTDISNADLITVAFKFTGGTHTDGYTSLSAGGGFPGNLSSIAAVGILEEHRFYVRQEFAVAGDPTSDLMPRLSRARVFPGTDVPHRGEAANWGIDIADGILDLQVALGLDTDGDGAVLEDGTQNDEWLFNHPVDDVTENRWETMIGSAPPRPTPLFFLRLTTLARTDRRDRDYQSAPLVALEDHAYDSPPSDRFNSREERMYRRRPLVTVIDTRNL